MSFAEDFRKLTDHPPYPWQEALFDRMVKSDLPNALDIPTGLGKTSIIAVWLLARAANTALPRRMVYVVDRRAVVDQATEEAVRLAKNLHGFPDLRARLGLPDDASMTDDSDKRPLALPVSTLRGQFADNRKWSENPTLPAIIVGTVDMIGSRLLFSGYRLSPKMRSVHAALLARDSLIVLDEAHLNAPFHGLLRDAVALDDPAQSTPVPPPLRVMSLTATAAKNGGGELSLTDADLQNENVDAKLRAPKPLSIVPFEGKDSALVTRIAEDAWSSTDDGAKGIRVLVFCNKRDIARDTASALKKRIKDFAKAQKKDLSEERQVQLLTGERRIWERQELKTEPLYRRFLSLPPILEDKKEKTFDASVPQFLIATSAGEVGIDLDAQAMVCDLVAWERMVQRLGRVNRRGSTTPAPVAVIAALSDKDEEAARQNATRALLQQLPLNETGAYDASVGALRDLKARVPAEDICAASTPDPLRPQLTRPMLDGWAMTSLQEDHTGSPDIAPWLRGWVEEEEPHCEVFWRTWLPWRAGDSRPIRTEVADYLDAAPPQLTEMLEAPAGRVVDILRKRLEREQPDSAHVDLKSGCVMLLDTRDVLLGAWSFDALRDTLEDPRARKRFEDEAAGKRLLVQAGLGGLNAGLLDADSDSVGTLDNDKDWGDLAGLRFTMDGVDDDTAKNWKPQFEMALTPENISPPRMLTVLVKRDGSKDAGDWAISRNAQVLAEHHRWASAAVEWLLADLVPEPWKTLLADAIRVHDLGKARYVWQLAMGANNIKSKEEGPYAKTPGIGANYALLKGYRHEYGSYLEARTMFDQVSPDDRDLALHLIASHHGYARPYMPPELPRDANAAVNLLPDDARTETFAIALRFARLQKQWGPWGLAWWEAVFRAADWLASSWNDNHTLIPAELKSQLLEAV